MIIPKSSPTTINRLLNNRYRLFSRIGLGWIKHSRSCSLIGPAWEIPRHCIVNTELWGKSGTMTWAVSKSVGDPLILHTYHIRLRLFLYTVDNIYLSFPVLFLPPPSSLSFFYRPTFLRWINTIGYTALQTFGPQKRRPFLCVGYEKSLHTSWMMAFRRAFHEKSIYIGSRLVED